MDSKMILALLAAAAVAMYFFHQQRKRCPCPKKRCQERYLDYADFEPPAAAIVVPAAGPTPTILPRPVSTVSVSSGSPTIIAPPPPVYMDPEGEGPVTGATASYSLYD